MNSVLKNLSQSRRVLGVVGTLKLLGAKYKKSREYEQMLARVRASPGSASLRGIETATTLPTLSERERSDLEKEATAMLSDQNHFFTLPYQTRSIERPWNFDPIEKKYWPQRHYTEKLLHATDTPSDVKIVWEINRFKDLPTLAEAAVVFKDQKYAEEVERRIQSWIDDNPFAQSINWASALEIGIRLLSWSASLELLRRTGMQLKNSASVEQSIWQQAVYLASDLSTDKVVRTNHLIGEAAGLFVSSILWQYPEAATHEARARNILEKEILSQTFPDGSTKESSTWYHRFVTDFFRIASRVATSVGRPFTAAYSERLLAMERFVASMKAPDGSLIRIGDSDDGEALLLGTSTKQAWENYLFGGEAREMTDRRSYFPEGGYLSLITDHSQLAMRTGAFGMGGDGFSSHAHDDLLAPVLLLGGLPVLVDPGTYVYNGDSKKRASFRGAEAHNSIVVGPNTGAIQKLNFGWIKARKDARLIALDREKGTCVAEFGEWAAQHERKITLSANELLIEDDLHVEENKIPAVGQVTWHLHIAPIWKLETIEHDNARFISEANELNIQLRGPFTEFHAEQSCYSPSYLREEPATALHIATTKLHSQFQIAITLS